MERTQSSQQQALCEAPQDTLRQALPNASFRQMNPAELIAAIFNVTKHPLALDVLVTVLAELWGVRDQYESLDEPAHANSKQPTELADPRADIGAQVGNRIYLQRLWEEVCTLPVRQRTALLLHLRDENGNSLTPLLTHLGIVSIVQLAAALDPAATNARAALDIVADLHWSHVAAALYHSAVVVRSAD